MKKFFLGVLIGALFGSLMTYYIVNFNKNEKKQESETMTKEKTNNENLNLKQEHFNVQVSLAKKYYHSLYNKDYDTVKSLVADEFVFSDPTVDDKQGLPKHIEGISNFVEYMDRGTPSEDIDFKINITYIFESNDNVVLYVDSKMTGTEAFFGGQSLNNITVSTKGITVLEFKNEKITKHTDYFDYQSLNKSIVLQLSKNKK